MDCEWDPDKAESNRRKHGVDCADAVGAFHDPFAMTQDDPHANEQRFVTIGRGFSIAWCSCRGCGAAQTYGSFRRGNATPRERQQYTERLDDA